MAKRKIQSTTTVTTEAKRSSFTEGFFHILLAIVLFFIKVGEITHFLVSSIVLLPVAVVKWIIKLPALLFSKKNVGTPAKRGRGRPPKEQKVEKKPLFSFLSRKPVIMTKQAPVESEVKRGRGRPRKYPVAQPSFIQKLRMTLAGISLFGLGNKFKPHRGRPVKHSAHLKRGTGTVLRFLKHASRLLGRFIIYLIIYTIKKILWLLRIFFTIFFAILKAPFVFLFFKLDAKIRFFILGFFVCGVIFSVLQVQSFIQHLPSPTQIGKINYSLSTHIYDIKGRLLYEIYKDTNRTPIHLKDIPPYVYQASIAIEDKDFYNHKGVSLYSGILRALKEIVVKKSLQGGSTITQQLVKSALLSPERTITRKLKEIVLALWTEQIYTKDQILEMYLNQVAYGGDSYGVEESAKTYFGKSAKELTIAEAALLAGLPQAPSDYSPFVNPDLAITRRNQVLNQMKLQGYISKKEEEDALKEPLHIVSPKTTINAPHFVFYVKSQLEDQYGVKQVEEGGLNVTTTLDLDIQRKAEEILKMEIDKARPLNVTNGAILVTQPSTGAILAMVGSVDYFAQPSGAVNLTTSLRQPGSSAKPLLYSLALQKGYTAATLIDDSPTTFFIPGAAPYRPVNYDGKFHGAVPFRIALGNSFNIPAVKLLNSVGVENYANYAERLGITTWDDSDRWGLSMALGGMEVKMIDMATAFSGFANEGYKVPVSGIAHMENVQGESLYTLNPEKTKVMNEGVAYIMSDVLSDNFARQVEFGPNSELVIPGYKVAVKTGTTDDKRDNWTIGYTPDFLVAVWVGNNDNSPMNPALASGLTGAAPIWNDMMSYLLKTYGKGNNWYTQPDNVVQKTCYFGRPEYFLKGTENSVGCSAPVNVSPAQKNQPTQQTQTNTTTATTQPQNNKNRGRRVEVQQVPYNR